MTGTSEKRRIERQPSGQKILRGLIKRRCRRGAAEESSGCSLVPRGLIRAMAVDVSGLIRSFSEMPKAKSDTNLFRNSHEADKEAHRRKSNFDIKLGKLTTENEILKRKVEEANMKLRDLGRQLMYERAFYEEQKSQYIKAMRWRIETRNVKTQTYAVDFAYESDQVTTLVSELRAVRELYLKQKALTANICSKYVKMRDSKELVIHKMRRMEEHYQNTIQEAMTHFDRDRVAFALLEKEGVLPKELHADMALRCSTLSFNNAALLAALLKIKSEHLGKYSKNDLTGDLSIYSILKDTKDLAKADKNLKSKKRWKNRELVDESCSGETKILGKFVSLPVLVNEGGRSSCKITPLFEVENDEDLSCTEEQDNSNDEVDEVEVDCSYKKKRRRRVCFSTSSMTRASSTTYVERTSSQDTVPYSVESSSSFNEDTLLENEGSYKTKTNRCESQVDIKEKAPRPPRTGSAPDIIQATGALHTNF